MLNKNLIISQQNPGESSAQYAYRILRKNIMQMVLCPGDLINEAIISNLLGISRTPVHEAMLRLRDEMLVNIVPRKESRVSFISVPLVNEAVFARCSLEPELVTALAGNLSTEQMKLFKDNLELQNNILNSDGNLYDFYPVDDAFHKLLYEFSNKIELYNMVKKLSSNFERVRYLMRLANIYDIERKSYEGHLRLYNILLFGVNNDIDLKKFFLNHILRFQLCEQLMENYYDYFLFEHLTNEQ